MGCHMKCGGHPDFGSSPNELCNDEPSTTAGHLDEFPSDALFDFRRKDLFSGIVHSVKEAFNSAITITNRPTQDRQQLKSNMIHSISAHMLRVQTTDSTAHLHNRRSTLRWHSMSNLLDKRALSYSPWSSYNECTMLYSPTSPAETPRDEPEKTFQRATEMTPTLSDSSDSANPSPTAKPSSARAEYIKSQSSTMSQSTDMSQYFDDFERMYIEPWYGRRLFKTSCFLCIPVLVAVGLAVWDCAIVSGTVFLTSINHWRRPRLCSRRLMDMFVVKVAALHHAYVSCSEARYPGGYFWLLCLVLSSICYHIAAGFGRQGDHNKGSRVHMVLHSIGLVANVGLYTTLSEQRNSKNINLLSLERREEVDCGISILSVSIAFVIGAIVLACCYLEPIYPHGIEAADFIATAEVTEEYDEQKQNRVDNNNNNDDNNNDDNNNDDNNNNDNNNNDHNNNNDNDNDDNNNNNDHGKLVYDLSDAD